MTWLYFSSAHEATRRRQWQATPVLLPRKSHGRRSLVGCSPWGCYESDMTEKLPFHALEKEMATHSSVFAWRIPGTGEPGGLPFYGVAQSQTQLKWLSSSSMKQLVCFWKGSRLSREDDLSDLFRRKSTRLIEQENQWVLLHGPLVYRNAWPLYISLHHFLFFKILRNDTQRKMKKQNILA